MLAKIKAKLRSVDTINSLCIGAEQHALRDQQREPGAEHYLLAALDLPDGTAGRAFESIGADPASLRAAIARQYQDALLALGIDPQLATLADEAAPLPAKSGLYEASASGKELMLGLADKRRTHNPLVGAHVVAVVATMKHGVAARALRAMGIDADRLRSAAEEIAQQAASSS